MNLIPAESDGIRMPLQGDCVSNLVRSIGTDQYNFACFNFLKQSLKVDHWILFRHDRDDKTHRIANASEAYDLAVKDSINRYIQRCRNVDPVLLAVRALLPRFPCIAKMNVEDINDEEYRHCFNQTHVKERLSYFQSDGPNLFQLSVFRMIGKRSFSPADIANFSVLGDIVLATAIKHERLKRLALGLPTHTEVGSVERLLKCIPHCLSEREAQVCARAVTGMTAEGTAIDLAIKATSVLTYKSRAYKKLNIARKNQLVVLVNDLLSTSGFDANPIYSSISTKRPTHFQKPEARGLS